MAAPQKRSIVALVAKGMPFLIVFAALAYAVVFYVFLLKPQAGRLLRGGELDLGGDRARLAETESYVDKVKTAVAAYKSTDAALRDRVENMVTAEPDVPGLFVQIDRIAAGAGLQLISIDAVPDEKTTVAGGRKIVRSSFSVAGGQYPEFKRFLVDLERSERIIDAQTVVFNPLTGNYGLVIRSYHID